MTIKTSLFYAVGLSFLLSACSSIPKTPEGFEQKIVETEKMNFLTWEKKNIASNKTLRFYIDKNGNPNPEKPMALLLAQKDRTKNIVVLTRPCQYLDNKICKNDKIWQEERYNPEILNEMYEVSLSFIKQYTPRNIEFVAYEDAAPIAFNLAQRYGKANKIVTIAGVLDIDSFERQNEPIKIKHKNFVNKGFVSAIPQIHYIGSEDKKVTKSMTERFISNLIHPKKITVKVVHGMNHDDWDNVQLDY